MRQVEGQPARVGGRRGADRDRCPVERTDLFGARRGRQRAGGKQDQNKQRKREINKKRRGANAPYNLAVVGLGSDLQSRARYLVSA
jgi:hypothetical protein